MATFYLFGSSQAQRTLNAGEVGFVAEGASLALQDDAVVVNGNADLAIFGTVFSGDDNGINQQSAQFRLSVGATGQLVSQSLYGLYSRFTSLLTVENAGYVSGYYYGLYGRVTDGFGNAYVSNSGMITSVVGSAVRLQPGTASAYLTNSGTIQGYTGVQIVGDVSQITNSGTIAALGAPGGFGWAISGGSKRDAIDNSGTILGRVYTQSGDDEIWNTGSMQQLQTGAGSDVVMSVGGTMGDVAMGDDDDRFRNAGAAGHVDLDAGNDVYDGRGGTAESVSGGDGDDTLTGGDGDDLLAGGAGGDDLRGGDGDDTLDGGLNSDLLVGGRGNDEIGGGLGFDVLRGFAGDDTLRGGGGSDILEGNKGDDMLDGGGGADTFVFSAGDGFDTVADFQDGTDLIDLTALALTGYGASLSAHAVETAGGVLIDLSETYGLSILLRGVAEADLSNADFLF